MSGINVDSSLPLARVGDSETSTHGLSMAGSVYYSAPSTVTNGKAQGFRIDADGTLVISSSSGPLQVVGNVADGVADSGNPVKVGAVYLSSLPTYTTGQRANLHVDVNGKLIIGLPSGASTEATLLNLFNLYSQNFGAATGAIRTASLIGNVSGLADFGAGATSAQSLRVVLPTDQSAIPVSQSGVWSITASNPSVSATGAAVPASATFVGGSDGANLKAFKVSATGVLSVDGSAVTQPVSGPLTDTQLRATAVPVSGTVTANVGTTGGLALDATLALLTLSQGSTTSGQSGPLLQAAVATASPAYTNGQTSPLSLTTSGGLRVFAIQTTASNFNAQVVGNAASAASDSGNPVKIGSIFNTTLPTVTNGQRVDSQADARGKLLVKNLNSAGNSPGSTTVSTVVTLTAPANAVGFILMNLDTSTANVRYRIGATATTTSGQQMQPGRDSGYIPCAADITIVAESGTQNFDLQWILSN